MKQFRSSAWCRRMAQVIVCVLVVQLSPLPQLSGQYHLTFAPPRFLTTSLQLVQDFFSPSAQAQSQSVTCDVDKDGDVDRLDVNAIFNARGMPAIGDDPRDSNGDGFITINDGRFCVLQCTSPRCAILNRPVANAGPDQTVPRDSTVQLDGSGSTDIDGQSLTYHWEILEKPSGSAANLSDPTPVNPSIVVDQPGSYLIQLIVNDGTLDSLPDTVTINTANSAPVATAGEDQFVFVGDTTKLDGTASSDVDGDQLTFFWELTTTPDQSIATLSDPTAVMPTFLVDQPGIYEATLIVNDGTEPSQPDTVTITTQNSKPVADADGDQTAFVGDTVTLDGTGSHDVDGDQLTFSWALISKPDQSTATLTNPTDPNPTLTIDRFGTYVAQLIVNDGTVDSDPDTVMITTLNSKPVADAGDDQTVGIQDTVQLDGRDSFDADLNLLTFRWALTTKPPNSTATLLNETTDSPSFVPDLSGTYIAQLIVNDATVDSDPDTVMVTVINEPPQAANDSFETDEDRVLVIPTEGVLENDTDDGPRANLTTTLIDDVTTGTLQLNANGSLIYTPAENQTGITTFTYRANDGELNSQELAMVDIVVKPVNDAPKITSIPGIDATDKATYLYQVEVTDPDLNDTHTFSLQRAPPGMAIDETSGLVQWKPTTNQVGKQTVTVRVEDERGRADTQTFTITVAGVNAKPDVEAGPNQTVNEGDTVFLTPATFTDADTDDTHTATITWGDGSPSDPGTLTQGAGTGSVDGSHPYINDGSYTVEVCVTDDDGATGCDTLTVQVENIAPSIDAGSDQATNQGATVSLPPALFTDPGKTDQHTSVVDWGDGTIEPGKVMQETGGGMIEGAHVYSARGPFTAEVCVQDGQDSACDEVAVNINGPPNITSTPVTEASEEKPYIYQVTVDDPDPNETHTYDLLTKPDGMTIDVNTGLIQWSPTDQQIGDHQVTVEVTDVGGLTDTQSYTVAVAQVVNPPAITPILSQGMNEGTTLVVPVMASDPDGDQLTLSISGLHPFGTFVDNGNGNGTITFTPGFTAAGNYPTTVTVSAGSQSAASNFTLTVNNVNRAPAITSEAVTMGREQDPYTYQVMATDPDMPEQLTFFLDKAPNGMTIDAATGLIEWTPVDTVITLDNSLLPSAQGWRYASREDSVPETDIYAVSGGILSHNTIGQGQGGIGIRFYGFDNIVDPSESFILKMRARVLEEEHNSANNSFGFAFSVAPGNEAFSIGLGTHRIQQNSSVGEVISTSIDNTVFHDYRMEGEFGVGFQLYVDEVLVWTGPPRAEMLGNGIGIGDFTFGTNARAEIQSYSFTQPRPVTVRVQDAGGLSATQSFTVMVKEPTTPPTAQPQSVTTLEDTPVEIILSGSNANGDALTCAIDTPPTQGSLGAIQQCVPPPSGLVSGWPGNGNAQDIVDGNPGTLVNGATFAPGKVGQAFSFDGVNDFVQVADHPSLNPGTGSFSLEAWIKTSLVTPGGQAIVTKRAGSLYWFWVVNGKLQGVLRDNDPLNDGASSAQGLTGTQDVADGQFHHVAMVRDIAAGEFRLYVDGTLDVSAALDESGLIQVADPLLIGAQKVAGQNAQQAFFSGLIDEVTFSNRALTADDIRVIFDAGRAGKCQSPTSSCNVTYTPNPDVNGTDLFTFTTTDEAQTSDPATVSINITPVNDPPVITSTPVDTAIQGQPYTYDVEATDPDVGDSRTFFLDVAPTGMTIDPPTGLIAWTPKAAQIGINAIKVRVQDSGGLFATQEFTITVVASPDRPTAVDDTFTAVEGQPLSVPAPGVLGNDSDPTNDPLTARLVVNPIEGTLALNTEGSFTYTANTDGNIPPPPLITSLPVITALAGEPYTYLATANTVITLDNSLLPSAQGWLYNAFGEAVPETDIFAVSGGILSQNTLGQGFGNTIAGGPAGVRTYGFGNIVDPSVPFTLKVRARVLEEEKQNPTTSSFGFAFSVTQGSEVLSFGLGTHRIQEGDFNGDVISTSIDNTVFHDYRMEGEFGVGFDLYVDDVLVGTGPSTAGTFGNGIGFGDFTRGTNAHAEIQSYSFSQPRSLTTAEDSFTYVANDGGLDSNVATATIAINPVVARTFSLDMAPTGMTIDPTTGLIAWSPEVTQIGEHAVMVRVEDGAGQFDTQPFTLSVTTTEHVVCGEILLEPLIGGMIFTPDRTKFYVIRTAPSCPADVSLDPQGEIFVIDTATNTKTGTIPLAVGFPTGMAVTPDGTRAYLAVSKFGGCITSNGVDRIEVIDTSTDTIMATIPTGKLGATGVVITPDGLRAYVTDRSVHNLVHVIDTGSNTIIKSISIGLGSKPAGIEISPDGSRVYTSNVASADVSVIDTQSDTVVATIPLALSQGFSGGLSAMSPDGTRLYVINSTDATVVVVDTDPGSPTVHQQIALIDTPTALLVGIRVSPNGRRLYLTNSVDQQLMVFDTDPQSPTFHTLIDSVALPPNPVGIAIQNVPDPRVYVSDPEDGTVKYLCAPDDDISITAPSITSTPVTTASPGQPYTYDVEATDPDPGNQEQLVFSLVTFPEKMTIDSSSGVIQWTPTVTQLGANEVTVQVTDPTGLVDTQSFVILTGLVDFPGNDPPLAFPQTVTTPEETPVELVLTGIDPEGDSLTFAIDTPPTQGSVGPIQTCPAPLTDLVSWWPGEGNANDVQDGNNGLENGATFGQGQVGQAFSFDGVNDFVQVADNPNLDPGAGSFSLEAWIKTFQTVGQSVIVSKYECGQSCPSGAASLYYFRVFNGKLSGSLQDGDPANPAQSLFGTQNIADGKFHHVAMVRDIVAGEFRLYVDGALDVSEVVLESGLIKNDDGEADPLLIGARFQGGQNAKVNLFSGLIDEVGYYGRALTACEIQALFTAGMGGNSRDRISTATTTYTPNPEATGPDSFTFTTNDGQLTSNPATVDINITSDNQPPMITSTPNTLGIETHPYSYLVQATDPDGGDEPTFSLESAPVGMTIDEFTGLVAWTPTTAQLGNHDVTVKVTDDRGAFDIQSYTVKVSALQDQITLVEPGFTASTCASGGLLDQPRGIVFDTAGNLLVANNATELGPGQPVLGTILRIDPLGTQEIFSSGDFLFGPLGLAFGPNSTSGFNGDLFVGVEDVDEAGVLPTDVVARIPANSGTPTVFFTQTEEPIGLRFGPGGAFGTSMYVAGRQHATDRKYRIFRVDASGAGTVFPLNNIGTEITGVINFEFAPGGSFGTNLYVVTGDDLDFIDPLAQNAIYRVDPTGAATQFLSGRRTGSLAFSPDPAGPFGEFLYATASQGEVIRINPQGGVSTFATGFTSPFGLAFSPEGNLCVSDAGAGIIVQLSSTPTQLAPPVIVTSTPVTEAVVGESYVYDVEATSAQGSAGLTFSLAVSPSGMSIDATTGLIEWTPGVGQVGDHDVVVRVKSPEGLIGAQLFAVTVTVPKGVVPDVVGLGQTNAEAAIIGAVLTVGNITTANSPTVSTGNVISQNPNAGTLIEEGSAVDLVISLGPFNANGPSFTTDPVTQAIQDQPYQYEAKATDPDVVNGTGDFLTFSLELFPTGMTIDPTSGLIQWTPIATQVGAHAVTARVTDSSGSFATQSFTVSVANVNDPPSFTTMPFTTGTQGQLYVYAIGITDPDPGDAVRVILEQLPVGMFVNPALGQLQWIPTPSQIGPHPVRIRLKDLAGAEAIQVFTITVANVNDPPTITSKPDDTGIQGVPYTYQPVVADLDLGIDENLTFSFDSTVPPEGMTIDPSTGLVEWTPTAAQLGNNAVTVKVTDKGGLTNEQAFTVNVLIPNDAPVANAGRDLTIGVGKTAHLNGTGSYDVNGDRLTFTWTLRTFPLGTTATLSDTNALRPTLVPDLPGNFTVELIVNDGRASSTIDVLVISAINSPPVANAGHNQTVPVGTNVTLDSSGSTDVDGDPLTFTWELVTVPVGSVATLSDPNAVQPTFAVDVAGTYEARLVVNDGNADSAPDIVTITTNNLPPVADAGLDQTVAVGATVNLDGSGSFDPNGDPRTHQWAILYAPTNSTAVLVDPTSLTPTFVADLAGLYVVQLIEDDGQAACMPDTVIISTGRSPPVANAGADQSVNLNVTVNLDGTGSTDPDNDPFTANWSFLVLPTSSQAVFSDPASLTPSFETDKEGLYIAQLITNDATEDSVPDTVVITSAIPTTTVPNVEGVTQENAEGDLTAAVLGVGTIIPQNSATIAKGIIINQTPAAGTVVPEGTLINLVVSIADDDPVLATIDVMPAELSLASGLTKQYTATGNMSDGLTSDLTSEVEWNTQDIPIAGITPAGEARALDRGTTQVIAILDGVSGSTSLMVLNPTLVSIEVSPTEALIIEDETQTFTAIGVLTDGTRTDLSRLVTWESNDQAIVTINQIGQASALAQGGVTITAKQGAIEGTATLTVEDRVNQDTTRPIVEIIFPVEPNPGEMLPELISPTDVIGTVTDDNLLFYELSLARVSDGTFIPFATGITPFTNGVLGTIDTTLLENGMYLLRLFAKDQNGQTDTVERAIRIDGQAKVGNFTLSFVDLEIPVVGIPITVTRTYDSRDKTKGDFGIGWTLEISRGTYENSRPIGEGWQNVSGFFPCQQIRENPDELPHFTEIRLSDQEFYFFIPTLAVTGTTVGGCFAQAGFVFVDGSRPGATLEVLGNTQVFSQNNGLGVLDLATFGLFDPQQVRLTTLDGRVFELDRIDGTFRILDQNNNALSITTNGVIHSSGKSILFKRDSQGRVREIVDPLGNILEYNYDAVGNLVAFIDRKKNQTKFHYDTQHNLIEVLDAFGVPGLRTKYGNDGKLQRILDASENEISFNHEVAQRREIVSEPGNAVTIFEYDERGNVVHQVNPEDDETFFRYDPNDNLIEQKVLLEDGTPVITTLEWEKGRLHSVIGPENRISRLKYDKRGNLVKIMQFLGSDLIAELVTKYDATGNPIELIDEGGRTVNVQYDNAGNFQTIKDENGISTYIFDNFGNVTRIGDPDGSFRRFSWDDSGNLQALSTDWINPDDSSDIRRLTRSFRYDENANMVQIEDKNGNNAFQEYDALGRIIRSVDFLGIETQILYDIRGKEVERRSSNGIVVRAVFNERGALEVLTDSFDPKLTELPPANRILYDLAGRAVGSERLAFAKIKVRGSLGGIAESILVEAGPVLSKTTKELNATDQLVEFNDPIVGMRKDERNLIGLPISTTNALQQTTIRRFNPLGGIKEIIDPLQRSTTFEYDPLGNLRFTRFEDNAVQEFRYDDLGRRTMEISPLGLVRRFEYDSFGKVTAVVLPAPGSMAGGVNPRYQFSQDQFENLRSINDPLGRERRFTYDERNLLTKEIAPSGRMRQMEYDNNERLVRIEEADGIIAAFQQDATGNLVQNQYFSNQAAFAANLPGLVITRKYNSLGQLLEIQDPRRGNTEIKYDNLGQPFILSGPEGTLTYTYYDNGLLSNVTTDSTEVRYDYDLLGRLEYVRVLMANGAPINPPKVTKYSYDAVGNQQGVDLPNGVHQEFMYDGRNRLEDITITDSQGGVLARFHYVLDDDGRRTNVTEERRKEDGSLSRTEIEYGYDDLGRLIREESQDLSGGQQGINFTVEYEYDLAGNRTREIRSTNNDQVETFYVYDEDDRLLSAVVVDGPLRTFEYGENGELRRITIDGSEVVRIEYTLDGRISKATRFGTTEEGKPEILTTQYQYGQNGFRVRLESTRNVDGVLVSSEVRSFLVDQFNPTGFPQVLEEHIQGGERTTYMIGNDLMGQINGTSGGIQYFGPDGRGSTRILMNEDGNITDRFDFDAYGRPLGFKESTASTKFLFDGEYFEQGVGQYFLRARYYDPETGRFNRPDPLPGNILDPQSLNKYIFVSGDPINKVDPSGLETQLQQSVTVTQGTQVRLASLPNLAALNKIGTIVSLVSSIGISILSYGFSKTQLDPMAIELRGLASDLAMLSGTASSINLLLTAAAKVEDASLKMQLVQVAKAGTIPVTIATPGISGPLSLLKYGPKVITGLFFVEFIIFVSTLGVGIGAVNVALGETTDAINQLNLPIPPIKVTIPLGFFEGEQGIIETLKFSGRLVFGGLIPGGLRPFEDIQRARKVVQQYKVGDTVGAAAAAFYFGFQLKEYDPVIKVCFGC